MMFEDSRPSRMETFMETAEVFAKRGTCKRGKVGAVIVGENKVIATGYNSSHKGTTHCVDADCLMEGDHCVRCLHAEEAAIINMETRRIQDLTLYVTLNPCIRCYKLVTSMGVKQIFYKTLYAPFTPAYEQLIREIEV